MLRRHIQTIAFALTVVTQAIHAQSSDSFEVAIVRPSGPSSVFQSTVTPSQFVASRYTLQMLIISSYPDGLRISGGPTWMATEEWDLTAKLPPGAPTDQEHLYRATERMLRTFLAEEFKLRTHFEQRQQAVYDLVVAKGGPKLKPSESAERTVRPTSDGLEFRHETMEEFAAFLFCPRCNRIDRPVFDETGLSGYYDFTLKWSPSDQLDADDLGLVALQRAASAIGPETSVREGLRRFSRHRSGGTAQAKLGFNGKVFRGEGTEQTPHFCSRLLARDHEHVTLPASTNVRL